ncbi:MULTISPECIES: deaminase domain-containing protein [unclassified Brevibacillus]|uniref:deaminase domain-containing protein n=1 Tax=unclassified Brevibacillus TaxID=2684853 RepID=UPI0035623CE8
MQAGKDSNSFVIEITDDSEVVEITQKVNKQNVVNGEEAWDRATDTEFKILNEIATKLGENKEAVGKIKMYTDLDCCSSCSNVIGQFKEKYPKIEIEVIYKTKGGGT